VPDSELSAEYLLMHALNLPPTTPRAGLFQYGRKEGGDEVELSESRWREGGREGGKEGFLFMHA